jgi:hypothetical protein
MKSSTMKIMREALLDSPLAKLVSVEEMELVPILVLMVVLGSLGMYLGEKTINHFFK